MQISGFGMNGFAEHSLLNHIHDRQFVIAVIAVFQHHAVPLCLFGGIDQFPAIGNGSGCGDFQRHVFAVFHGIDRYRHMQIGRRGNVDQINVIPFADFFPVLRSGVIIDFVRIFFPIQIFLNFIQLALVEITCRFDRCVVRECRP